MLNTNFVKIKIQKEKAHIYNPRHLDDVKLFLINLFLNSKQIIHIGFDSCKELKTPNTLIIANIQRYVIDP